MRKLSPEQMIKEYTTVYIFKLSIFRLQLMKSINIINNLEKYLTNNQPDDLQKIFWLFNLEFEELTNNLDMKMVVNDRMHFCIRINLKN
jgi:hypothetical protein